MGGQFASDDFQAFRRTDDHAIGAQLLFVVREVAHANVGLAEEAMAARGVSRSQSAEEELQGLAIEHADKPTDGANEARALEAGPGHGAWPSEVVNGARQDVEQQ